MKKIKDLSLKTKMQLITFFSIGLISIMSFSSMYFITKANNTVLYDTLFSSLSYSSNELSNSLDAINSMSNLIFSNDLLQKGLYEYKYSDNAFEKNQIKFKLYDFLSRYMYSSENDFVDYITIYQNSDVVTTSNLIKSNIKDEIRDNLISTAKNANGESVWVYDYTNDEGLFLVKEIRRIEDLSLEPLGFLVININLNELINSTTIFNSYYEDAGCMLMSDENIIYQSADLFNESNLINTNFPDNSYKLVSINDKKYFTIKGKVPNFNFDYLYYVYYEPIVLTSKIVIHSSIAMIILTVLLIIILSSKIISEITKHFDILIYKMKCFGEGNYENIKTKYDYSENQDEISLLHNNFDEMVKEVNNLIQKNYIHEIDKKQVKIELLESQIDPHFLYNTLEVINWRAKLVGDKTISEMTMALGNILRITLKKGDVYTLKMELEALENFINIQKLRYDDTIKYIINAPENLKNCQMPKFVLQPLVENAILYGLEDSDDVCYIYIDINVVENNIIVEVKNTGSYFENNLLNKLNSGNIKPSGFGIGLLNIEKRIKITYGENFGLKLYNIEDENYNEYAVVRVTLPKID